MKNNDRQTILHGDAIVDKSDSRIELRGKLDSIYTLVELVRERFLENVPESTEEGFKCTSDMLGELMVDLCSVQIAEAKNAVPLQLVKKYAVMQEKLREINLWHHGYDSWGGLFNYIRTQLREAELAACRVPQCSCVQAIQAILNTMSDQAAYIAQYWYDEALC